MNVDIAVVLSREEELPEVDAWLVVDVLRATTTITTWFANGGRRLLPVASPDDARQRRESLGDDWLLLGEQNARPLEGFDLGNSPLVLTPEFLQINPQGIISTTNGTGALLEVARSGRPVYAACARNAYACAQMALNCGEQIGILCAGRHGRVSLDDALCAGLIVDRLMTLSGSAMLNDGGVISYGIWKRTGGNLFPALCASEHAKLLLELGLEADVRFCAEIDCVNTVPVLRNWGDFPAFICETNGE